MICFVSVGFWCKKIGYNVSSAECYMNFVMFKQIPTFSYQGAIICESSPDLSMVCGVCGIRFSKCVFDIWT